MPSAPQCLSICLEVEHCHKRGLRNDLPLLPLGRRWPEGPDEGFPLMTEKTTAWIRRSGATGRARALRQNETDAEYCLWTDLRNRRLNGYKFSRQIPLGPYIADFVCREKNLIIELDGSQHEGCQRDVIRTKWLNANGYSVLRFWNTAVLQERHSVLETIVAALDGRLTTADDNDQFYPSDSIREYIP